MKRVTLGSTGLRVSAQGLGCMGMSHGYGPADQAESLAVLRRALELGVTFWDTADYYANGANERLLATVLADHRAEVEIATKFGLVGGVTPSGGAQQVRGDPPYVRAACDASLRRLRVDVIDLYYQHRVDVSVPIEDTVGAMAELVDAGKVRHLGLSEATATELRRAHAVHPIAAVQSEWSLWSRDVEAAVVPACRELGVGFVPYSPLGRGFLTGQLTAIDSLPENDIRRAQPRLQAGVVDANRALVDVVRKVAAALGATPAQVALAWVHHRAAVWEVPVVPIPGTKRTRWLDQNVAAVELHLPADALERLDGLAERAAGDRHPQMGLTSAGDRP
ncbi:MAG: aldo/keto reductase [Jiangellaceae bacterium]|nr:aldo/keto reductase [Jiangellaceae bacterium]